MNVLNISDLHKSFGGRTIFDGVSFAVDEAEKIGFIGVNGTGKSTLFRIIAGLEGADSGDIALRRMARVGYLAQEPDLTAGLSIHGAVTEGRPNVHAAHHEHEDWSWAHRVEAMLTRLGVTDWDRTVDDLSGGEQKRVALARTLLAQPEILLLDEPTNHLDADTVLFLEEYLIDYAGAVLLITHDRYFLDRVVDRMIEVADGALTTYTGGYTEYLEAQAARAEQQAIVDAKRRKLIDKELEWARRSPPARTGKQRARIARAEGLEAESRTFGRSQTRDMRLQAPDTARLGRTVLNLHAVAKAFDGHTLIRDFTTILRAGERIGIIGPNGAGKTTLVRIILGEEPVDSGVVEVGVNTQIAYFDQLRTQLEPQLSVYEAAGGTDWVEIAGQRKHLRSYLEDFLFPTERQQQKVSSLSGGERNRLMLAKLFMQPSNVLILDEPTNDLDLVTLQVLEAALLDYPGCVLAVTHDRFFLDKVATALFVFEGAGIVHRHDGGFELYRRLREQREAEAAATAAKVAERERDRVRRAGPTASSPAKRRLNWKDQRELEGMEAAILAAESTLAALAARLEDPGLYRNALEAAAVTAAFEEARGSVDVLYARWAELEQAAT